MVHNLYIFGYVIAFSFKYVIAGRLLYFAERSLIHLLTALNNTLEVIQTSLVVVVVVSQYKIVPPPSDHTLTEIWVFILKKSTTLRVRQTQLRT